MRTLLGILFVGCTSSCMFQTLANARLAQIDDTLAETTMTEVREVHRAPGPREVLASPPPRVEATAEPIDESRRVVVTLKASGNKAEVLEQPIEPAPPAPNAGDARAALAYGAALQFFNAGELGKTIAALTEFIDQHPTDARVVSAIYWRAEAYAASGDCTRAIADLDTVLGRAAGDKEPDALFALGTCQTKVGNARAAHDTFRKLALKFPRSDAAQRVP
ncbi:MAG TPA: tetratricopeptide repeat protein [Polyangiaceae bacterium]